MPLKLPKANTDFGGLTDTNLSIQAQAIKAGLAASVADFPTPPVDPTSLQALIDAYNSALALATGPGAGRVNTERKNAAKLALKNALRADQQYVNTVIYTEASSGVDYATLQTMVLGTGYLLNKQPTPAGPLPAPNVIKNGSFNKGQIYILLEKVPNAKGYSVKILDTAPGSIQQVMAFPGTRITIPNLVSGHTYDIAIASIGANPTLNYSIQFEQVVI